jgi:hypothetical protein
MMYPETLKDVIDDFHDDLSIIEAQASAVRWRMLAIFLPIILGVILLIILDMGG